MPLVFGGNQPYEVNGLKEAMRRDENLSGNRIGACDDGGNLVTIDSSTYMQSILII